MERLKIKGRIEGVNYDLDLIADRKTTDQLCLLFARLTDDDHYERQLVDQFQVEGGILIANLEED